MFATCGYHGPVFSSLQQGERPLHATGSANLEDSNEARRAGGGLSLPESYSQPYGYSSFVSSWAALSYLLLPLLLSVIFLSIAHSFVKEAFQSAMCNTVCYFAQALHANT